MALPFHQLIENLTERAYELLALDLRFGELEDQIEVLALGPKAERELSRAALARIALALVISDFVAREVLGRDLLDQREHLLDRILTDDLEERRA